MAYVITDLNDFEISLDDGEKVVTIWKQNIRFGAITGDVLRLQWHNKAQIDSRYYEDIDWNDVTAPVVASAAALQTAIEGMISSGWGGGGGVSSVTDDGGGVVTVDNTDPANPVVGFGGVNVDGVTITGDGTAGTPLSVDPAGLTGFVPYTGATSDVDLGVFNLTNTGQVNTTAVNLTEIPHPAAPVAGDIILYAYDHNGFTIPHYEDENGNYIEITRDNLAVARNVSGGAINKGEVVYVSGTTGTIPQVTKARADSLNTLPVFGVMYETTNNNAYGRVMISGELENFDLSAFANGDEVYLSAITTGALTATAPSAPNYAVFVGIILNNGVGNGVLLVRIGSSQMVNNGDYGDITVTSSGKTWTIDNNVVTYAKMQDVTATARIIGRKTAGSGDPEECTLSEILDFLGSAAHGDILYRDSAGWAYLPAGTSGQFLQTQGAAADPTWSASTGYTLDFVTSNTSPIDSQTLYMGAGALTTTSANQRKLYIRKAGTIKMANVFSYSTTAGSNEAWSFYIRLNDTTDTLIETVSAATNERVWDNSALNITVAAGDYIEFKAVNPAWGTNPNGTHYAGYVYIE